MGRRSAPRATYRHDSPQLVLAGTPAPEAQGTMFDVGPVAPRPGSRCTSCGAELASGHWDRCRRCVEIGAEATTLGLDAEADESAPADPSQMWDKVDPKIGHRARCDGVLMAPVFGVGRTSCNVCDWSPDDLEDRREPETMHLVSWPREANGAAWCETCGSHACDGAVAAAHMIDDRTFPAWIAT